MRLLWALLILLPSIALGQNLPPTLGQGSFRATGELVETYTDSPDITLHAAFEENYDSETANSAFTVWEIGANVTYVEDGKTHQIMQYTNDTTCQVLSEGDWIQIDAPPSLMGFNTSDGRVRFALKSLLSLDNKYLNKDFRNEPTTFRNLPARSWLYVIIGTEEHSDIVINIDAYWSDPAWKTTSGEKQVPLGFEIKKIVTMNGTDPAMSSQFVSVFSFVDGIFDKKAFRPREGIYCPSRIHPQQLPTFPLVRSFSFRSEFVLRDYQNIKNMEVWYNIDDGFLRVDLDRFDDNNSLNPSRRYTSQITSRKIGTTFRVDAFQGVMSCTVQSLDKYDFDIQEIINPKLDLEAWNIFALLGEESVDHYVYMGKTYKRNLPCHMYQAYRDDWPDPSHNIISVWEWCFSVKLTDEDEITNFREHEIGLVSASIKIAESDKPFFPINYRMVHHIYDAIDEDPRNMSLTNFQVDRCFSWSEKYYLQVALNETVNSANIAKFESLTSDLTFLWLWKSVVENVTGIANYSLRVTGLESLIFNKQVFVEFKLLGLHKDLPEEAKKGQPDLETAFKALKKAVEGGKLNIAYKPASTGKTIYLKAVETSLNEVFKRSFITEPITAVDVDTTTKQTKETDFSLITDDVKSSSTTSPESKSTSPGGDKSTSPDSDKSTSPDGDKSTSPDVDSSSVSSPISDGSSTPSPTIKPVYKYAGHPKGAVAGTAIAMLLVGVTIGAGGTFYKFKGMPSRFF